MTDVNRYALPKECENLPRSGHAKYIPRFFSRTYLFALYFSAASRVKCQEMQIPAGISFNTNTSFLCAVSKGYVLQLATVQRVNNPNGILRVNLLYNVQIMGMGQQYASLSNKRCTTNIWFYVRDFVISESFWKIWSNFCSVCYCLSASTASV